VSMISRIRVEGCPASASPWYSFGLATLLHQMLRATFNLLLKCKVIGG
jgi:hypothetical protein